MCANYRIMGNTDASALFGGDKNLELMLKSMNMAKTIGVALGKEYYPPYVWNDNLPVGFAKILAEKVGEALIKNIKFKPDEAFIDGLRKDLRKMVSK